MDVKGIDISYCQEGMDIKKAKDAGVKFAIIRAGFSTKEDVTADAHIKNCNANGIDIGFYWYSYANTVAEAKAEAQACLAFLKKHDKPTYGVWYDTEENKIAQKNGREITTDIALAFMDEVHKGGYPCGLYVNPAWMEQYYNKTRLQGVDIWLAHWTENPSVKSRYNYGQIMWQWGLDKTINGGVDGDLCFVDMPARTKAWYAAHNTPTTSTATNKVMYNKLSDVIRATGARITAYFKEMSSLWSSGWHNGIDIAAPAGTPIYAAADGVVINADTVSANNDGYGNRVLIECDDGKAILYAHMRDKALVKVDKSVLRGQVIGYVGCTGHSTGAHLHISVFDNYREKPNIYYAGNPVDPASVLGLGTFTLPNAAKPSEPFNSSGSSAKYKVGDIVDFTGNKHYRSSIGTTALKCTPGKAKVTQIVAGTLHPVHLIKISGGGSTVYGWVDTADINAGKTIDELAGEVIAGKWGNGNDRKKRLTDAGYDYTAVQKRVNEILHT